MALLIWYWCINLPMCFARYVNYCSLYLFTWVRVRLIVVLCFVFVCLFACLFFLLTFHGSNFHGSTFWQTFVVLATPLYLSTFVRLILLFFVLFCFVFWVFFACRFSPPNFSGGQPFGKKFVALAAPIFYTFRRAGPAILHLIRTT